MTGTATLGVTRPFGINLFKTLVFKTHIMWTPEHVLGPRKWDRISFQIQVQSERCQINNSKNYRQWKEITCQILCWITLKENNGGCWEPSCPQHSAQESWNWYVMPMLYSVLIYWQNVVGTKEQVLPPKQAFLCNFTGAGWRINLGCKSYQHVVDRMLKTPCCSNYF